jgi:pimeloyl-ACP methyl ester carboxylesterase
MRSNRLAAFAIATALTIGLAACSSGSSGSSTTTRTPVTIKGSADLSDFYGVPDPLPAATPGTIIKSEPVTVAGLNGTMSRVMYHSTTINGDDIAVTGLIAIPNRAAPAGGWPVVSWAHGTTGIADMCAPSLKPDGLLALANPLLDAGYLVVASDFEGLGTPGRHPYIVGDSEAHGTLDIVKVAQTFPDANASKRYLIWGHSQGGHAALFAGHDAKDYAPGLELVGVVAGAPPSQLLLINAALQTSPYKYYIAMAAAAFNAAYGDTKAPLDAVLTQEGIDFLKNIDTMCPTDLAKAAANIDFTKLQKADPATIPTWNELLRANDAGTWTTPIPSPLLIIHGGSDEQIPVVSSALLFDQLCHIGQVEQRWVFAGQSHAGVIVPSAPSMLTWIADRFADQPMPDPIEPPGAVVQSCGKS